MTLEASLLVPIFLIVLLMLTSAGEILMIHQQISHGACEEAKRAAVNEYRIRQKKKSGSDLSGFSAKAAFLTAVNRKFLDHSALIGGSAGAAATISHMPLYKKLKERIKEGAIGNTKMVQVNFGSNKGYDSTQRFFALEAAGGALLDIGVYATAFARTFLSEMPNTILTTVEYLETGADEQSGIIMKNTKGEMVVMCLTLRAKQPKRGVVTGDKGYIEVYEYPRACKATITNTATGEVETVEAGKTEDALKYEVEAMEAAIEGNLEDDCQIITKDTMRILTSIKTQWGMKYPFE